MATTVKQGKSNVNSVPEASTDTICLPDGDVRIAELAYYKAETEVLNRVTNLMTGLRRNGNFCCSKERGGKHPIRQYSVM